LQKTLTKGQMICGLEALEARRILKRFDGPGVSLKQALKKCELPEPYLMQLLNTFSTEGYLAKTDFESYTTWSATSKAKQLFDNAPKRNIKRTVAQKKLDLFLERIKLLNNDAYYLWRVKRAAVFGSYLGDKTLLGDLDVAIELAPRHSDIDIHNQLSEARRRRAYIQGQKFPNISLELLHPVLECYSFLKAGSAKLNITELTDIEEMKFPFRIIYVCDASDFASSENPESLRPYSLSPRTVLGLSALKHTIINTVEFHEGDRITVLPKNEWTLPVQVQSKDDDDWVFNDAVLPANRLSTVELLNLAASICQGHSIVFHCRETEAQEYCNRESCPACGKKQWRIDMVFAPTITCENCAHKVNFGWKPKRTIKSF
jgi:predicted nucleotidyltransferase